MILLILVFIMILVGIVFDQQAETKTVQTNNQKTVISNSYNNYNTYTTHNSYVVKNYEKKYHKEVLWEGKDCLKDPERKAYCYDSYGKHERNYMFGTYANTYRVYVKNDCEGYYFKVKFYFKNKYGDTEIKTIRKYVSSGEKELFYYRDISKDKNEYYSWKYKVFRN